MPLVPASVRRVPHFDPVENVRAEPIRRGALVPSGCFSFSPPGLVSGVIVSELVSMDQSISQLTPPAQGERPCSAFRCSTPTANSAHTGTANTWLIDPIQFAVSIDRNRVRGEAELGERDRF